MRVEFSSLRTDRIRQVHERLAAQPNWAVRAAAMTFAFVVLLPIVLLVAVAFLFAMLVLTVLALASRVAGLLTRKRAAPGHPESGQGRRNVTVLPRES